MKLHTLRGENLASLAAPFEIDFDAEPIRSAGVFVISGPTGAGKSTLLDAICLALYGELPRLAAAEKTGKRNDAASILRPDAVSCYAEIEFSTATGERYRARWSLRRARKKISGKVQKPARELVECKTGAPIGETATNVQAEIIARVGLSYEQFHRSALLAQGEFDAFLRASPGDRAALLEKITGGEIYSALGSAAYERGRAEAAAVAALQTKFGAQDVLPDDQRALAEAQDHQTREALAAAEQKQKEAAKAEDWARALLRHQQKYGGLRAQAAQAAFAKSKAEQTAYLCAAGALSAMQHTRRRNARVLEDTHLDAPLAARRDEIIQSIQNLEQSQKQAQRALQLEQEAKAKAKAAASAASEALEAVEHAQKRLAQAEQTAQDAQQTAQEHPTQRPQRKLEAISAALHAQTALSAAQKAKEKSLEAQAEAQADLKAEQEAQAKAAQSAEAAARQEAPLTALRDAAREELDKWKRATSETAEDLRAHLTPGEPCPVCGALEHRFARLKATLDTNVQDAAKQLNARESDLKTAAAQRAAAEALANNAAQRKTEAARRLAHRTQTHEQAEHCVKAAHEKRAEAYGALEEAGVEPCENLQHAHETAKAKLQIALEAQKSLAAARTQLDIRRAKRDAAQQSLTRSRDAEQGAQLEAQKAGERQRAEAAQITRLETTLDAWLAPTTPNWRGANTQDLIKQVRRKADLRANAEAQDSTIAALLPVLQRDFDYVEAWGNADQPVPQATQAEAKQAREAAIKAQNAMAAAEAAQLQAKAALDEHQQASPIVIEAGDDLAALIEQLAERSKNAQAQKVQAATAAETARLAITLDDQARARRAKSAAELAAREEKAQVWLKLEEMIGSAKGDKFRNYAQSLTFEHLITAANTRLAELHPRYELTPLAIGELALAVIDKDMADERRAAHNLSGGERFLVSLALALGLSSLSGEAGARVDTLFIDEGFGTLDTDSLSMAVSALEALPATGRRVGVISHVGELQERIGTAIRVKPTGGGRSKVELSSPQRPAS